MYKESSDFSEFQRITQIALDKLNELDINNPIQELLVNILLIYVIINSFIN